jgi:two-component system NtrC family response regulator
MRSIEKYCTRFGITVKGFYPEFLEALVRYRWPGNVRELVAAVEAAVIHGKDEPLLHPIHLPVHIRANLAQKAVRGSTPPLEASMDNDPGTMLSHAQYMQDAEKRYFKEVGAAANGTINEICRLSGLSRAQVYRLIKKHNITL